MLAANEVIPTIQRIIADREAVRNLVASKVTPETATFADVIQPWLEEEDLNQGTEAVIDMYRFAGPDQESVNAAEEAKRLMSECTARLALRHDLFLLVKAVADKDDCPNEECRKAVRDILREYTNVGHGKLSSDQIEMLLDSRKEIGQLCQDFNRNLRENTEGAWFTPRELEGMSMQEIQRLTDNGKVYVDFGKRADRLVVLRHAHSPATRKKLYLGNEQKLSENVALFKTVALLHDDNAHLLGYKSHAEFKLQARIATSTEWVDGMLNRMREQLLPIGQGVMEQLKAIKRKHLATDPQSGDDEIFPWDFHYYMRLLEEDKRVDQELVSEYFPLRNTVLRMLGLFASFLQLRFLPMAPGELTGRTWHEDVEAWSVWDDRTEHKGEFIGYLFSDILYRNGKYKGNQNVNLQAVSIRTF
jgi:metallopeptidase MepB